MYFECQDCGHRQSYYRRHCPCCWGTTIDRVTPTPTPDERQVIDMMALVIETIEKKEEAKSVPSI